MLRTQVYLTKDEREGLQELSRSTGKKQSELIRMAVDDLIEHASGRDRDLILRETAGMWKNRDDLPDFDAMRKSWDRDA